ncbi:MAG: DnaJ domain-containing protein [Methyloceanibacter sp.]|uniref:J domain-containing protein n=1 Tax=Methyloceanibacter sp. TaxID=1965321 RepID=UPI003D6CEADC
MNDLYQILGVKPAAPRKDIHKAYRRKAKSAHPDTGGSVEAFNELVVAYAVLSDPKRRRRYDETGEIDPPRPDNFDGGAIEIIAEKLGLVIHAEHDLSSMDVGALIEQAIRDDIADRKGSVVHQKRAAERLGRLRGRARRKANGEDNLVARVLDWHGLAIQNRIKKHEESVLFLERALEILQDYSFTDDLAVAQADEVTGALNDILVALDELAAILNTSPARADAMPRGAAPTAFG